MGDESFVITSGTEFVSTNDPGLNYTDSLALHPPLILGLIMSTLIAGTKLTPRGLLRLRATQPWLPLLVSRYSGGPFTGIS